MRQKAVLFLMIISAVFILLSHFYCLFFYGMQPSYIRKNVQKGIPYVFQKEEDYLGEIQKLRITDDYVYILYGGKSIVKAYQHDGTYIGTIAVYDKRATGGTSLYTDHKKAYIDHDDCLYEFEGIDFIHCYTYDTGEKSEKLKTVENSVIKAADYSFRFGNVIKYEGTPQEYVFIGRDLLHRLAYPGVLYFAEVGVVLIWVLIFKYIRIRQTADQKVSHGK